MALTERLTETTQAGYWTGEIPLEYIYTYGRAGEAYFRNLMKNGSFLGARCEKCELIYVPPRIYCERCFDRLERSYINVGTTGTVHTFTVLFRNLDGSKKEEPIILGMIKLDGTDGGVVHYLGGIKPDAVVIGLKVKAVLKPKKDRQGNMGDIRHFAPVK